MAHGVEPKEVDRIARLHTRGSFAVCAFHSLGYRLGTTEPVMAHDLARIPRCASPATIERVTTSEMSERVARYARSRQLLPEHLADPITCRCGSTWRWSAARSSASGAS